MSALMTPRRARRNGRAKAPKPAGQPSLFAAAATAAAPAPVAPVREPAPVAPARQAPETTTAPEIAAVPETFTTASARRQGPTLDDLVAGAWEGLLAGAPAACLVCGTALTPRHSAGAGIVGGRCGGCGSTVS
jgi:hypothetical protein